MLGLIGLLLAATVVGVVAMFWDELFELVKSATKGIVEKIISIKTFIVKTFSGFKNIVEIETENEIYWTEQYVEESDVPEEYRKKAYARLGRKVETTDELYATLEI